MAKPNSVLNRRLRVMLLMTLCLISSISSTVMAQLVSNFYKTSCPNAESTITTAVNSAFNKRRASAPGVLRIHFHDCFVNGCDGSVLIDSPSEKDAVPNLTLDGWEVIDAAKTAVEEICPGVVSCADILALASQLSVGLMSGGRITWKVPTGRRDGLSSTSASTNQKLPSPDNSVSQLKSLFAGVGLSTDQMVTLSGAHSIGVAHCNAFQSRLGTPPDSTLDSTYAAALQSSCPGGVSGTSTNTVDLDLTTPRTLDEVYFKNLQVKKGLLTSDQNLQNDAETQPMVAANTDFATWGPKFRDAMIAMGNINVLTGTAGNIRQGEQRFTLRKKELKMQMLCEKVRQLEERVWKEENQRGKHIPGYGGFIPLEEDSPANDIKLPRYHVRDMEVWGGKQSGYCGFKPERPPCENPDYMWGLDHSRNNHYTTTYGQANQSTIACRARLKYRPPIVRPPYPHEDPKAKKGVKGFFYENPSMASSEEGKKLSEKFFAVVRPLEGTLLSMNSSRSIKSAVMS